MPTARGPVSRTRVAALWLVVASGLVAHDPPPAWQVWWERNAGILLDASLAEDGDLGSVSDRELFTWARHLGDRGDRAVLFLGRRTLPPGRRLLMVDELARGGRRALAAALALGGSDDPAALGYLEGLAEDRPSGRALAGDVTRAVPTALRASAALGLGMQGHPAGFAVLRRLAGDDRLPVGLRECALVGISFSPEVHDARAVLSILQTAGVPPLVQEAAAAAVGRNGTRLASETEALVDAMKRPGAARGAAVALWYEGVGDGAQVVEALRDAALNHPDPVTRGLAAVALAGRGAECASDVVDRLLRDPAAPRDFAVVALGLLGRARASERGRGLDRLSELPADLNASKTKARSLLASPGGRSRPDRSRRVRLVAGGNALMLDSELMLSLLDLAVKIPD